MTQSRLFTVYFEFFGRKMRTEVEAYDLDDAVRQVKDRIIIYKVDQSEPERTVLDFFEQIWNGKH